MTKLSANMITTLITVADKGRVVVWGRAKASALALSKRGLVEIRSEGGGDGLSLKITDAGFALAVELV